MHAGNGQTPTIGAQGLLMDEIGGIVGQREHIHLVALRHGPQLVKRTNLVAFVGWERNAVAEVEDFHGCRRIGRRGRI